MLIVTTKGFKKQYVIGGARVFDTLVNFLRKVFTSDAANQLASTAAKEGVNVGKTAALEAGKKLATKLFTSKSQGVTQKTKDTLDQLINQETTNIMMGTGSVAIQDLVRRLNGGGKKVV